MHLKGLVGVWDPEGIAVVITLQSQTRLPPS